MIHWALHPGFADDVPYATVIVELTEGVCMVSQAVDLPVEQLRLGLPVEVVFEDVTATVTLPKFRACTPPDVEEPLIQEQAMAIATASPTSTVSLHWPGVSKNAIFWHILLPGLWACSCR